MNDNTNTYRTDRAGHDITRHDVVASEKVNDSKSTRQASSGKAVAKSSVRAAREASGPYPSLFGRPPSEIAEVFRATGQRTIYTPDVASSIPPHMRREQPGRSLDLKPSYHLALKADGIPVAPLQKAAPNKKRSPQIRRAAGEQRTSKASSSTPAPVLDAAAEARIRRILEPFDGNAMEWATVIFHHQTMQSVKNMGGTIRERRIYFDYEAEDNAGDEVLQELHLLEDAFLGLLSTERKRRGDEEMEAILKGEDIATWCPSFCIQYASKTLEKIKVAVARVEEVVRAQAEEGDRLLAQAVRDCWVGDEDWVGPVEAHSSNV